jgi:hypothetical protein
MQQVGLVASRVARELLVGEQARRQVLLAEGRGDPVRDFLPVTAGPDRAPDGREDRLRAATDDPGQATTGIPGACDGGGSCGTGCCGHGTSMAKLLLSHAIDLLLFALMHVS